jgi:hypothetical protein
MIDRDRRRFLTGAMASLGYATVGVDRLAAFTQAAGAAKPQHHRYAQHFAPPAWVAEVKDGRCQAANTTWTPAKSIEDMDRAGVAAAVVHYQSRDVVRRSRGDAARGPPATLRREARAGLPEQVRVVRLMRCPMSSAGRKSPMSSTR